MADGRAQRDQPHVTPSLGPRSHEWKSAVEIFFLRYFFQIHYYDYYYSRLVNVVCLFFADSFDTMGPSVALSSAYERRVPPLSLGSMKSIYALFDTIYGTGSATLSTTARDHESSRTSTAILVSIRFFLLLFFFIRFRTVEPVPFCTTRRRELVDF